MPKATKAGSSNQWEPAPEAPEDAVAVIQLYDVESDDLIGAGPADARVGRPVVNAAKAAWIDYAVDQGMSRTDAEAVTKAELIEKLKEPEAS